ncbi:glycosyltransferase family 4 protein [Kitasatospora kifunensis]|uniref:Glycosyltransferase involved in cell wall biosynthesis n=1 Tax=Kitasatospora kifunensis TaxID=58351 RepID=A0A7W7R6F0_KITKI|nr:glycosyltransferase [Kitasatospora kifunensis]MBB4926290.1 glycosyltransferase involved in cell wall biosynthesis [Kitasatospora kifunensis]
MTWPAERTGRVEPAEPRAHTERTVLLATPYFPPDTGGVEQYTWQLARQLRARHGYRVVVAATVGDGVAAGRIEQEDGLVVHRLPAPLRISRTRVGLGWRAALRTLIRQEQVDLVNAHAPVPLFADAAARASGPLPFVLTYHTGRMRKGDPLGTAVCSLYERTLLTGTVRRAGELICSSDYVQADLARLFAGRATTISPGVDLDRFTPSPVPSEPRILFAGSLERATSYKGLPDLLRVLAELAVRVPGVRLEVVGDGSAAAAHQRLAHRLGIAELVRFSGRLTGEELVAAYRRARVLALPTHYDSFPSVLVEAMASGRPVVSTRVGGIPSLVTEGGPGLLADPGDLPGLAAALGAVLSDDALAERLGAAGRRRAVADLSWQRQADRTAEVFARALAGRRRRGVAVVAPYYPPKIGGVENYAARIAGAVAADPGLRAAVITTNTASRRTTVRVEDGLPVVRLGTWARLSNTPLSPLWLLQVPYWLRRLGVDVVSAHAPVPGLGDLAVALSGARPAVLTYHAGSMAKGQRGVDQLIGGYERLLLPRLFARAGALVAVSPVSLAAGRRCALRIPPGVDTDRFTPGPPAVRRTPTVLYVGRMDRTSAWKGVPVLLRAFALLADLPKARLRLVGDGDAVPELRAEAVRLGVAERVEFTGALTGPALVTELQRAALLVLPSLSSAESFGMTLIEAMACATPVIGSRVGGIPYVIDDEVTGLLVAPGEADELAAACRRLLTDADTADRLGTAGRRHVVEQYAWPGLTRRYLALFRALTPA